MRSRSMQSLTDAVKRRHPGVVVYGLGDDQHKLRTSDHNEDDTAGSRAAQTDADTVPEHRAIDIMLGPAFSRADAYALIDDLLAPESRARLFYILFNGWRWSRSTSWAKVEFDGDPHDDHIHISGWAADDETAAGWPAVEGDDMTPAQAYVQHVGNYRTDAIRGLKPVIKVPAFESGGQKWPAFEETNHLAVAINALGAKLDALAAQPGGPATEGLTAADATAIVRAELDKTRLVGG